MISIVGVFAEFGPAQSAKNELLVAGFKWNQVQLSPDHEVEPRERSAHPQPGDQSVQATMGNLVRGWFGGGGNRSAHGDLYGASLRHGDYVLIVDTDSEQERTQAEDIMRRHAPADLARRGN